MLAQGTMLAMFVAIYMSEEFLETRLRDILRARGYEGGMGEAAYTAIAEIYEGLDAGAREQLRTALTDVNFWAWRITTEGIRAICEALLTGIDNDNISAITACNLIDVQCLTCVYCAALHR